MSDWLMGALAAQDQYNPEEGAHQADLLRAQQPARDPQLDPGIRRAPGDVVMRPAAETFGQVVGDLVIPQDPLDYAAMFALGPAGKLASKGARAGALAMGGVLGLSDEAEAGKLDLIRKGIKAYHSSPHDFEKFDASKIGTGEGAQVYGHGLYFAENPAVSGQGGQYWKAFSERFKEGPEGKAVQYLKHHNIDRKTAADALDEEIAWHQFNMKEGTNPKAAAENARIQADLIQARDLLRSGQPVGPRTYEVNIRADPQQMLDWDKGLHRQSPEVRNALEQFGIRSNTKLMQEADDALYKALTGNTDVTIPRALADPTGATIYRNKIGPATVASRQLAEAGIPGIKYLDEGSRGRVNALEAFGQKPTSNYVVFDPSIVDIMKKYGIAGAAAPMGALAAQDEYR